MWHASIVERHPKHFRPVNAPHVMNKKLAYAIGEELLDGVGIGETYRKAGEMAFHVRRSLSSEEIAGLDPVWVAIPAIDMAG